MDNDSTLTANATQGIFKAKKWNVLKWPSQSNQPRSKHQNTVDFLGILNTTISRFYTDCRLKKQENV